MARREASRNHRVLMGTTNEGGESSMKVRGRMLPRMFAVLVIGLGLAAHGGAGAPAARAAAGWTLPTQPVTVTYWDTGDGTKGALLREMIAEYQKLHPNVTIKFETDVKSDKIAVAVSAGTAADIFEVADFNLPKFLAVHALDPLPTSAWGQPGIEGVLNNYLPSVLAAMTQEGKLYAIPDQMNAHSLYINNRLFREAGLDPVKDAPKTWADVARLNKVLTKKQGDRIVQKGFEMRYVCPDGHWISHMMHILIYQHGGEVIRDGKPKFDSPAGLEALRVWKSVTVAPQVTQNTCSSPYQDFAVEQDAMTFMGPNGGPTVEQINPNMKGNYNVVTLPQLRANRPATLIYSYNWAVNAKATDDAKKVAWDLIHYLSTRPDRWWGRIRFLQGAKGWYDLPAAKDSPFLSVFVHDLSVGRPLGRTTHYGELQTILARMIDRVVLNNADPKQSLSQATEEFNRASQ
jgi:multiple sugar transport system substrate-binding protein